jgi:hypothetical protein
VGGGALFVFGIRQDLNVRHVLHLNITLAVLHQLLKFQARSGTDICRLSTAQEKARLEHIALHSR